MCREECTRRGLVVAAAFLSFLLLFSFFVEGCGYVENIMKMAVVKAKAEAGLIWYCFDV